MGVCVKERERERERAPERKRAIFNIRKGEGNWERKFSIKDVNLTNNMLNLTRHLRNGYSNHNEISSDRQILKRLTIADVSEVVKQ